LGIGQRLFSFDGRTSDLLAAMLMPQTRTKTKQAATTIRHRSTKVIQGFNSLQHTDKQAILDFLRSL
jgi:hypothetical protein